MTYGSNSYGSAPYAGEFSTGATVSSTADAALGGLTATAVGTRTVSGTAVATLGGLTATIVVTPKEAYGYSYINVGPAFAQAREGYGYNFENIGPNFVQAREGYGYNYENVVAAVAAWYVGGLKLG